MDGAKQNLKTTCVNRVVQARCIYSLYLTSSSSTDNSLRLRIVVPAHLREFRKAPRKG